MPIIGIIASSYAQAPHYMGAWAAAGNMASNRSRPTPLAVGSNIYLLTGDPSGATANTTMTYSNGSTTWTTNSSYPYTTLGPWATWISGASLAWMGGGYTGGTNVYTSSNMTSFANISGYPVAGLRSCTATGLGNVPYVSGGYSDVVGNWVQNSYSYNFGTGGWTAQTSYPVTTDTPATWSFDNTSKYYFTAGGVTYYYTGSGAWVSDTAPPVGLYGSFNNSTVKYGRVYLNGAATAWYSWTGSGGWRTETSQTNAGFGGAILDSTIYSKRDGYNTDIYKSVIG